MLRNASSTDSSFLIALAGCGSSGQSLVKQSWYAAAARVGWLPFFLAIWLGACGTSSDKNLDAFPDAPANADCSQPPPGPVTPSCPVHGCGCFWYVCSEGAWQEVVTLTCYGLDVGGFPGTCGNGIVEPPEQCDNGNIHGGDGCSLDCQVVIF